MKKRKLYEGQAVKFFAAETTLTEGEIINIAARDDNVNLPAEELDVNELADVLARHKEDILKQRQFRAQNGQREAGIIAADAIEKVAAGTYLTESQLAHLIDKSKSLNLAEITESKLIEMAIDSLSNYKPQGKDNHEGDWITVSESADVPDFSNLVFQSLNERMVQGKNHNLDLSLTNKLAIPSHMV